MFSRRDFIKTASAVGGIGLTGTVSTLAKRSQDSAGFFGLHPFVENHPEAVFIMRTDVDVKTNSEAKLKVGLDFGRSVIVPKAEEDGGIPLTHKIAIKPNLTCSSTSNKNYTLEYGMGIITDPYFVEGVIESMKELGFSGSQFYMREANCPEDFGPRGFTAMAERTGADLLGGVSSSSSADYLQWVDTPEGMAFRKIPYIWPINAPDTWLLNISKFKSHGMGLTLAAKNNQGSIALGYCGFCGAMSGLLQLTHKNPNAKSDITASFERHLADGIPRWDRPGTTWNSGLGMEVWVQRTVDNHSVTNTGLCIIEGIYGRDGNGFLLGPNPEGNENNPNGEAWDYMTNVIIFGKNPFYTDIIGHWLGGHEAGNMGLFHIAMERGLSETINPHAIPVYEWKNGEAVLTPLTDFERTPLKTYYLPRDYNGQDEPYYHLLNEPYDYGTITSVKEQTKPEAFVLSQNYPNPFNPNTSIEFSLPTYGYTRLEIYSASGQLVDVLVDGYRSAGSHMAVWNTSRRASGTYLYRLTFGGFSETKRMVLLK
ncbi:DUF362 domain-containing protein [bacterium]|nr:DUF362 domain-containing protein [bacterium]